MDTIIDMIINSDLINSIASVIKFILDIPNLIKNIMSALPSEIMLLLNAALIIIIALFLYRFVKWV